MVVHPLLLFPRPDLVKRQTLPLPIIQVHKPSLVRQTERLSPKFQQLQRTINARRVSVRSTTTGIEPEMVLVIEVIGDIVNFSNAVKRIPGLEWMGEIEDNSISPDDDFYNEADREKPLNGRLYLVMTNHEALDQMISLWRRYQEDPNMKFDYGFAKFRDVFLQLKDIRYWNEKDRLEESGIWDIWTRELQYDPSRRVRFETELWYRNSSQSQQASAERVKKIIEELDGRIINQSVIPEIVYHSLLADLPIHSIQEIVNHRDTKLIECENVMFFRPVGQMAAGRNAVEGDLTDISNVELQRVPTPSGDPIIAVLDGLPLENHRLLANRINVDDPDNWEDDYPASERLHGTAMLSLICHGDLNDGIHPLPRPVYIRPILKYDPEFHDEIMPDTEQLGVDLIYRAVRRIFEGEGDEGPSAPSVKIINLSIGYSNRQFLNTVSPLARLLDWLSERYNVLFVISAGNHLSSIETGMSRDAFNQLSPEEIEKIVVRALYSDSRNRRILSPAESINGLSIGSLHQDTAQIDPADTSRINLINSLLPSPISSFGKGYRRSVKPDCVYPGGRLLFDPPLPSVREVCLEGNLTKNAPGNKVATPGNVAGDLNKTFFDCGTSNAAALISRSANFYYDTLLEVFRDQGSEGLDYEPYLTPLIKSMIIHGCSWGEIESHISSIFDETDTNRIKNYVTRWCGYGIPDLNKSLYCTDQRVSLLGFGELLNNQAHVYHLPLPPSLTGTREKRKLTITLGWLSQINANSQKYRTASLWFDVNLDSLGVRRTDVDRHTVKRGTIQHEVFEGERILSENDPLEIRVNCRDDAGKIQSPVKYGLALSLEVAEGIELPIYNEIRTLISMRIPIPSESNNTQIS